MSRSLKTIPNFKRPPEPSIAALPLTYSTRMSTSSTFQPEGVLRLLRDRARYETMFGNQQLMGSWSYQSIALVTPALPARHVQLPLRQRGQLSIILNLDHVE